MELPPLTYPSPRVEGRNGAGQSLWVFRSFSFCLFDGGLWVTLYRLGIILGEVGEGRCAGYAFFRDVTAAVRAEGGLLVAGPVGAVLVFVFVVRWRQVYVAVREVRVVFPGRFVLRGTLESGVLRLERVAKFGEVRGAFVAHARGDECLPI